MQNYLLPSLFVSISTLLLSGSAEAQLIVDDVLSQATFTALGVSDTSTTSGTVDLLVSPGTSPFNTAQVVGLNLTLDQELQLSFAFGLATLESDAGSIQIELVSPGPAGSVAGGVFSQLENTLAASGQVDLNDRLNLVGGSMSFDLSTAGNQVADFSNVSITESGGMVTIDGSYSFTASANGVDLTVDGRIVASGTVNEALVLGDFNLDGVVNCSDLDGYVGNIGAAADGALAALDIDGNGTLDASDAELHITALVETSNGGVGTFPGDLNCDGTVDVLSDAFALVGNLGGSATSYAQGDINFDEAVDVLGDAFVLVGNLGNTNVP